MHLQFINDIIYQTSIQQSLVSTKGLSTWDSENLLNGSLLFSTKQIAKNWVTREPQRLGNSVLVMAKS